MNDLYLSWEPNTRMFESGKLLMVGGKWEVGKVFEESRPRGDTKTQAACSMLPGLKPILQYYESEADAMARVERATRYWFGVATGEVQK